MAALEKMNNAPHPYEHSRTPTLTVELAKGRSGRGDRGGRGPPPRRSGGYEERRRYDDRPVRFARLGRFLPLPDG